MPNQNKDDLRINFEEHIIRQASMQNIEESELKNLKKTALEFISNNPFPTRKNEAWKYYDFNDLFHNSELIFSNNQKTYLSNEDLIKIVYQYVLRECKDNLIVTYNGVFQESLSNFNNKDIELSSIRTSGYEPLARNQDMDLGDIYLRSLNTLFIENAFFIKVHKSKKINEPIQVLHIANQNSFNQIRSVIELEENSNLDIVVNYVGLEDSNYISNAIIDCHIKDNARLNLIKIQNDSKKAVTLYNLNAKLSRDANFEFNSFHFGAKSSRDEISVDLNGKNANTDLNGLYVVNKDRKTYQKITVNHNTEHCTSSQLYKGIACDQARAEFNGMIDVKQDAQKTDAKQLNNNLLLSETAHIDSRPQLNIYADDVKCAHGSTVGQLSKEEIFYLQSRGLSLEDAFTTLTYSFTEEILQRIKFDSVKNYATNLAFNNISSYAISAIDKLANNDKFKKSRALK